jgi:hypothetical protein
VGLAADTVGLGILDARGMALHADAQCGTQVEGLFVGEAELLGELVHPDLRCHVARATLSSVFGSDQSDRDGRPSGAGAAEGRRTGGGATSRRSPHGGAAVSQVFAGGG